MSDRLCDAQDRDNDDRQQIPHSVAHPGDCNQDVTQYHNYTEFYLASHQTAPLTYQYELFVLPCALVEERKQIFFQ